MSLSNAPLEDSMKRDTRSEVITRLHGYRLGIVRLICLSLCVLSMGLFVASILSYMADFDYESLYICQEADTGLKAIIAIHDTTLGPATGGCRCAGGGVR